MKMENVFVKLVRLEKEMCFMCTIYWILYPNKECRAFVYLCFLHHIRFTTYNSVKLELKDCNKDKLLFDIGSGTRNKKVK